MKDVALLHQEEIAMPNPELDAALGDLESILQVLTTAPNNDRVLQSALEQFEAIKPRMRPSGPGDIAGTIVASGVGAMEELERLVRMQLDDKDKKYDAIIRKMCRALQDGMSAWRKLL
ncbi:MAG TPA: hypothetical protein VMI56_20735 [Reyranella sp.]|nr:hypothetical protein [Reyranella sp.]